MATPAPTRTRPQRGAELELGVESIAFGGAGVARADGYVLFVAGAIPGDRVRAVVTKSKRDYGEARTVEVLEPSADRIPPLADHPGAPWQVLRYERQLEIKQAQVDEALRRIGHLDGFQLEPILPAVDQWRYRNKLEYSFGAGPGGELVCGFHAPGRFDEVVHVEDCLLASEADNAVRRAVVAWCRAQRLEPYDRRTQSGLLRNLVVRTAGAGERVQARVVSSPGDADAEALAAAVPADGLLWTTATGLGETTAGGETRLLAGSDTLEEELCGMRFRISPEAFFQTNSAMAERLYGIVAAYADLRGWERVFDLYCGIGTVGLTLAPRAAELWGMEIVVDAVADARENARLNDVDNARFVAADVRLGMRELVASVGRPDLCVVDPPRAGLSKKVVRRVIEAAPKRIVYVSCNPTTLAPNAAQLVEAGYRLERVTPVDMFPQTPHIECVALLTRGGQAA
jgi:23S rRNA (uracil1939-C5)-methyltransferase